MAANTLLSDIQARAARLRLRTSGELQEGLARAAWERGLQERAAGHPGAARRWLERARRLAPQDGTALASLAGLLLEQGEAAGAAALFQNLADRFGLPEAWTGLAASALVTGDLKRACAAAAAALQSSVPTPALRDVASRVAAQAGLPGWCGLDGEGQVHVQSAGPSPLRATHLALDGVKLRGRRLKPGWHAAASLVVERKGVPFLGSPLCPRAIAALDGFVAPEAGGLAGWAWHPADPARDPVVLVRGPGLGAMLTLREPAAPARPLAGPLARPRRLALSAADLHPFGHPVRVTDTHGRDLLGSPLDPGLEARAAAGLAPGFSPAWAGVVGATPQAGPAPPGVDVVIPVHAGMAETLACLDAVLATVPAGTGVHVIEDASPEPGLVAALEALAASGRIRLTRQPTRRGFPATANAGLRASAGRDVVLLNSDTLTPPGWLDRLRRAAYAAPDVGTATPLSNQASIASYPGPDGGNPAPDLDGTAALDRLAQCANGDLVVDLPVGVGFCLYLRRDCLDQAGLLREDLFAQGYGEEVDLCLRARHHGWRHVAAAGVFVAHLGGRSFGAARAHLLQRNGAILNRLHPGYDVLVARYAGALHPARRAMDALRWAAGQSQAGSVILVTHQGGGGVDQVTASRCAAVQDQGLRPVVLRPGPGGCHVGTPGGAFPNLSYTLPAELPALEALLRPGRPRHLELHHLLGHHPSVLELVNRLAVPVEAYVHDYAWFCPRIALVSTERRYCGEPDVAGCEACIADLGSLLDEDTDIRPLLARSAAQLGAARRVIAPSHDAATRLHRHFPHLRPEVQAWEDDRAWPALAPVPQAAIRRVCVVGAIGIEKGYEVLLACARDARRRGLALEFVVCGFTQDDARLMQAGPVFVTGAYQEHEAVALIRAQQAALAFIPSVWPETWCFALSRAWAAGLAAAAFGLGAQAERIRRTGRGWLLPPGLAAAAVNDALLRLAPASLASQCPAPQLC